MVTAPPQTRDDMDVTGGVCSLAARRKLAGIVQNHFGELNHYYPTAAKVGNLEER